MPQAHPQKSKPESRSEAIAVLLMGGTSLIGLILFALFRVYFG